MPYTLFQWNGNDLNQFQTHFTSGITSGSITASLKTATGSMVYNTVRFTMSDDFWTSGSSFYAIKLTSSLNRRFTVEYTATGCSGSALTRFGLMFGATSVNGQSTFNPTTFVGSGFLYAWRQNASTTEALVHQSGQPNVVAPSVGNIRVSTGSMTYHKWDIEMNSSSGSVSGGVWWNICLQQISVNLTNEVTSNFLFNRAGNNINTLIYSGSIWQGKTLDGLYLIFRQPTSGTNTGGAYIELDNLAIRKHPLGTGNEMF